MEQIWARNFRLWCQVFQTGRTRGCKTWTLAVCHWPPLLSRSDSASWRSGSEGHIWRLHVWASEKGSALLLYTSGTHFSVFVELFVFCPPVQPSVLSYIQPQLHLEQHLTQTQPQSWRLRHNIQKPDHPPQERGNITKYAASAVSHSST